MRKMLDAGKVKETVHSANARQYQRGTSKRLKPQNTSVESALEALAVAFFPCRCQYGTTLINTDQLKAKTTH